LGLPARPWMRPAAQFSDLLQDPQRIAQVELADVADLLGQLEIVRVQLWARLVGANAPVVASIDVSTTDRLLTPQEAAAVLKVGVRWLYRHRKRLPFARPISGKVLRFSEMGLQKWLEHQRGRA
jgi:excisionase family DNA binding protein